MSQHFSYTKLAHSAACTCGHGMSRVLESRKSNLGKSVRRRRECESCGARWTTYELHEDAIEVIRNQETSTRLELFQQVSKILRSLADRIDKAISEAKAEVKHQRNRAIHLEPALAVEPPPRGFKGEALEAFSVFSDIQGLNTKLVARSEEGEWFVREETNGEYLWFKFMGKAFPQLLEAAYKLDNQGKNLDLPVLGEVVN